MTPLNINVPVEGLNKLRDERNALQQKLKQHQDVLQDLVIWVSLYALTNNWEILLTLKDKILIADKLLED